MFKSKRSASVPAFIDLEKAQSDFRELLRHPEQGAEALISRPSSGAISEYRLSDLSATALRTEVAGSGAVIVRGLLSDAQAVKLREGAEHVLRALSEFRAATPSKDGWYAPFPALGDPREVNFSRQIVTLDEMGALLVDSPQLSTSYLAMLQELGVLRLVNGFLGAPAALSAEKSVIRRVPASTGTDWHQDGKFLGSQVRSLNLWVTLSDCGTAAPGLDLVASRPQHILPTGSDDAHFDWSISQSAVDEWRGATPVVHPEFRPGDAVFFDHMNVHRTGVRPGMTESRYALETWFFSPWHFPEGYTGITVG